jgi:hypothetical protein
MAESSRVEKRGHNSGGQGRLGIEGLRLFLFRRGLEQRPDIGKDERLFFSEEKKQKTFVHWRMRSPEPARQSQKVFWFFFSKKNISSLIR